MNITKERLKQELVLPSRKFSKLILEAYHSLKHFLKRTKIDKKQVPTLIWDIRSNPITFDFIWLIIDAYNYFRETGFSEYDVVIFTAKAKPDRGLINGKTGTQLVWEWLKKHNMDKFVTKVTAERPRAVAYIDDKNIEFKDWKNCFYWSLLYHRRWGNYW